MCGVTTPVTFLGHTYTKPDIAVCHIVTPQPPTHTLALSSKLTKLWLGARLGSHLSQQHQRKKSSDTPFFLVSFRCVFSWNSPKFVSQTFSDIFHLILSSFKQKLLVIGFKIVRKSSVTSEMQDISNFSLSFLLKGKKMCLIWRRARCFTIFKVELFWWASTLLNQASVALFFWEKLYHFSYACSHCHTYACSHFLVKATGLSFHCHLVAASDNTSVTTARTKT